MPFWDSQRPKILAWWTSKAAILGPGTAAEVLVFPMHGCAWPAELRRMFAAAGLDAGFFIGGDDEFIALSMRRLATRGHTSPAHDRLW